MTDQMMEMPDHLEDAGGGGANWRITDGKLRRGRGNGDEVKDGLLGFVVACRVHEDMSDDGPYANVELDLNTKAGTETVKATLRSAQGGKPTYSTCINLLRVIEQTQPGECVNLTPNLGSKPNKYGSLTTYLNAAVVEPGTWRVARKLETKGVLENGDEEIDRLCGVIRSLPHYKPRPTRAERQAGKDAADRQAGPAVPQAPRAATPAASTYDPTFDGEPPIWRDRLAAAIVQGGNRWKTIDADPKGWLSYVQSVFKGTPGVAQVPKALDDALPAFWDQLIPAIAGGKEPPAALAAPLMSSGADAFNL